MESTLRAAAKLARSSANYTGASGRSYAFKQLIQERPLVGCVWIARSGKENFILKDIPEKMYSAFNTRTRAHIKDSPRLRLPIDSIPGQRIFVYRFFTEDFLALVKKGIPLEARKEILKSSLQGLADLHAQDVVHLDVKPDNVVVDFHGNGSDFVVEKVQLADLENAMHLPRGLCLKGSNTGNDNWRSPEAHFRSELWKPTDIFSFGTMCIYAVLGRVIFGPDKDMKRHMDHGVFDFTVRLLRQVSYFGDRDGINGLLTIIEDDEFCVEYLSNARDIKDHENHGYKHFSTWPEIEDESFKDLVLSMMNLDPRRRITAEQALEHPWFKSVKLI